MYLYTCLILHPILHPFFYFFFTGLHSFSIFYYFSIFYFSFFLFFFKRASPPHDKDDGTDFLKEVEAMSEHYEAFVKNEASVQDLRKMMYQGGGRQQGGRLPSL